MKTENMQAFYSWLTTPHIAFCFLSTFCSLCEHGMPFLMLPSAAGSSLGSSSLDQALQQLWLPLYLTAASEPFPGMNHGNAMAL